MFSGPIENCVIPWSSQFFQKCLQQSAECLEESRSLILSLRTDSRLHLLLPIHVLLGQFIINIKFCVEIIGEGHLWLTGATAPPATLLTQHSESPVELVQVTRLFTAVSQPWATIEPSHYCSTAALQEMTPRYAAHRVTSTVGWIMQCHLSGCILRAAEWQELN